MSEKIEAFFIVTRVATLADNGIRVTLDMPEDAIMQMAKFAECKRQGVILKGVFEAEDKNESRGNVKQDEKRAPF